MKKQMPYDDYNGTFGTYDYVGAVTCQWGDKALRHGWKILEICESGKSQR